MPLPPALRRYTVELLAALTAYAVLLAGSLTALRQVPFASPWREVVSLAPLLAGAGVLLVVLRGVRALDELQRRIQFEAVAFAFAGTALLTFGYGFLENVGFPQRTMFWVWPVMAALWVAGQLLAQRRYR